MSFNLRFTSPAKFFFSALLSACFLSAYLSQAFADEFDTFNVVAGSSYVHDSNLFRLPSNLQPTTAGSERSDNILRNTLGVRINKQYSLQTFKVNFDHVDTSYANSKYLDFKANNYSANWLWALTPSLTGMLSADRTVSLVPFQDTQLANTVNTSPVQNIRTNESQLLNLDYSPHNKWHITGAISKLDSQNSQTFLPETSFMLSSIDLGLKYVFPSQSYISFVNRTSDGENSVFNASAFVGRGYEEKQQELSSFWLVSGKSRVVSNIGHISRVDDQFTLRNFSGIFGGVNYIWDVTGKTNISFGVSRRLSAFQTLTDSYSVSDVFSIIPLWQASSKITVRSNLQVGRRNYEGESVPGYTGVNIEREDKTLSYGIGMDWIPRSTIKVGLSLQHDERNSNAQDLDYTTNIASVTGQLTF